ncbi:MAG: hypothetical protein NZ874_08380, partial [Fimbriimonadales bacterium]|nr:hypothetical protein [Fimbriimonadales bacterium]
MQRRVVLWLFAGLASLCFAQDQTTQEPETPAPKPTIEVKKIAVYPWCFAENERGTNEQAVRTVQDLLRKSFENRAG